MVILVLPCSLLHVGWALSSNNLDDDDSDFAGFIESVDDMNANQM